MALELFNLDIFMSIIWKLKNFVNIRELIRKGIWLKGDNLGKKKSYEDKYWKCKKEWWRSDESLA
jgi:hypothetical protein